MPSFARRAIQLVGPHRFFRLLNLYPPYVGAGVRVTHVAEDLREIHVEMRLTPLNRNYVGTHFGGSLFAMCDPFFMLMLLENLGPDFVVWDKEATIRFLRPGRGTVRARFLLPEERLEAIRHEALRGPKAEPVFTCEVLDASGERVAEVRKVLHVRRKARAAAA